MSQKSKNLIFLEKSKNFQILKNPRKAQKHLKNAFHTISDHYKWFWTEKKIFRFFGSDDPISPKVPIPRYSSSWNSNSFSGILLWLIPTTYQKLSGKSCLWAEPTYLLIKNCLYFPNAHYGWILVFLSTGRAEPFK